MGQREVDNALKLIAGAILVLVSLLLFWAYLSIKDSMEGVCDTGNIFIEIMTAEECADAQQRANAYLMFGIGIAFFGLLCIYFGTRDTSSRGRGAGARDT